jgi:hypothetical protein
VADNERSPRNQAFVDVCEAHIAATDQAYTAYVDRRTAGNGDFPRYEAELKGFVWDLARDLLHIDRMYPKKATGA